MSGSVHTPKKLAALNNAPEANSRRQWIRAVAAAAMAVLRAEVVVGGGQASLNARYARDGTMVIVSFARPATSVTDALGTAKVA